MEAAYHTRVRSFRHQAQWIGQFMAQTDPRYQQYEQWVRAFSAELYRFAYRLTGKRETAEDLVQETFVEAWRSLENLKKPDYPRAWFFQILRYRYAHLIRDN